MTWTLQVEMEALMLLMGVTVGVIGLRRFLSRRLQAATLAVLYAAYFVGAYVTILTLLPWRQIALRALQ